MPPLRWTLKASAWPALTATIRWNWPVIFPRPASKADSKVKVSVGKLTATGGSPLALAKICLIPGFFYVVPKLCLGTHYTSKLSLAFIVVPKCNLGTS